MITSPATRKQPSKRLIILFSSLTLIVIIGLFIAIVQASHKTSGTIVSKKGCITEQLTIGTNNVCVSYAKTMVDYIETAGLNECPFTNGALLPINDQFDDQAFSQIKVVQTWINCYNKQEGSSQTISVNGMIDSSTWQILCSYGFTFPKQSHSTTSTYHTAAITAGQAAGCETE